MARSRSTRTDDRPWHRILLVGNRGAGKSTAGRLLAAHLGWQFIDADDLIEQRAGRSIAEIIGKESESGFRRREAELLKELVQIDRCVVATGGGVVLAPENRELLADSGFCVWLTCEPATARDRIADDPASHSRRPALTPLSDLDEIRALTAAREPLYAEVADVRIDTANKSPDEVVFAILSAWNTS